MADKITTTEGEAGADDPLATSPTAIQSKAALPPSTGASKEAATPLPSADLDAIKKKRKPAEAQPDPVEGSIAAPVEPSAAGTSVASPTVSIAEHTEIGSVVRHGDVIPLDTTSKRKVTNGGAKE